MLECWYISTFMLFCQELTYLDLEDLELLSRPFDCAAESFFDCVSLRSERFYRSALALDLGDY